MKSAPLIFALVLTVGHAQETLITQRPLNDVREGPGSYYPVLITVPRRTELIVLERSRGWVKVRLENGSSGWIASTSVWTQRESGSSVRLKNLQGNLKVARVEVAAAIKGFGETYSGLQTAEINEMYDDMQSQSVGDSLAAFKRAMATHRRPAASRPGLTALSNSREIEFSLSERQIGFGILTKHARGKVEKDPRLSMYLNLVLGAIVEEAPFYENAFHVTVTSDMAKHSIGLPGGGVMLSRGMINFCRDEAELAAVLAHEVAHIVLRHGMKELRDAAIRKRADDVFEELDKETGTRTETDKELSAIAVEMETKLLRGRSINEEREADALAVELMDEAGYDAAALESLLLRYQNESPAERGPLTVRSIHGTDFVSRLSALSSIEGYQEMSGERMAQRFAFYTAPLRSHKR